MEHELERRLELLSAEPLWAPLAQRVAEDLAGIRCRFRGEARERLERTAAGVLARQLSMAAGSERLETTDDEDLAAVLYEILLRLLPDEGATRH
jgi:hypothetical protein